MTETAFTPILAMSFFAPRQVFWPGCKPVMTPKLLRPFLSRLPALALMLGTLLVLGLTTAHAELREHNLWWTAPPASKNAHEVDALLLFIFWLTTAVFVATQAVYVYFIVKYRERKGVKAVYSHGNNTLEIVWTAIPAVIFISLAVYSDKLWFQLRGKAPKDALSLDIVAYQFGFHVRNPGIDNKLGSYSQLWMQKGDNNFGTDPTHDDPAGHDDYQSENLLTLPVNRPVNVVLRSQDVIHAFYVPEFRMYQDIVPGRTIDWVTFTPDRIGHYALACNQLCGNGHYNMQAKIDVLSQEDYAAFVKKSSEAATKNYEKAHPAPDAPKAAEAAPNPDPEVPKTVALAKP